VPTILPASRAALAEAETRASQAEDRATGAEVRLMQELDTNALLAEDFAELHESLADLELAADDAGYRKLAAAGNYEFTRDGLRQISLVCRLMGIKNPLIRRALALRHIYVWGSGVEISAREAGQDGAQDINAVIQRFLDEPLNQASISGAQAQAENERALGTDGNLFIALFTAPKTGAVRARVLPWDQVMDIVTNPEDTSEPWYYLRQWTTGPNNMLEPSSGSTQRVLYPDVRYQPKSRPAAYMGVKIQWDAPVVHVAVNKVSRTAKFGTPDAYPALDWARAYKEFLEDWARLVKSLSRYAWRLTAKGSKTKAIAAAVAKAPSRDALTDSPLNAGATAVGTPDLMLEAIPKTGATIDSESGKPLATMVAAAMDVPVTMLTGDPGHVGARATAQTLDQPLRLAMMARRREWTTVLETVLNYVVDASALAPGGVLTGTPVVDEYERRHVQLNGTTTRTFDIAWPDLAKPDPLALVTAIVAADQTGKMPELVTLRLLLQAFGVTDADEVLAEMTDDQGRFVAPQVTAGQAAVDAFRRGEDPAALVGDAGQADGEPADTPAA